MNPIYSAPIGQILRAVTLLGLLPLAGCSSKIYPVYGKIEYTDGQPAGELAGGMVEFESVNERVSASGEIRADGTFRLTTHQSGDGAVVGKHRVLVAPNPGNPDKPAPPPVIPARYKRFETSGLEVEVKPETNRVTLTVERIRR